MMFDMKNILIHCHITDHSLFSRISRNRVRSYKYYFFRPRAFSRLFVSTSQPRSSPALCPPPRSPTGPASGSTRRSGRSPGPPGRSPGSGLPGRSRKNRNASTGPNLCSSCTSRKAPEESMSRTRFYRRRYRPP